MGRPRIALGADAERARMSAAEQHHVPWRRWGPATGPGGLPGIVDEQHGIRLDLTFGRAGKRRAPSGGLLVEHHAATPTASFLRASVELPGGTGESPPCLLDIRFAKRAPEDIVIALTVAAGFGAALAAVDLGVTLSLAAAAAAVGEDRLPSVRLAPGTSGPDLPDGVTVLCAERSGCGTWWLAYDGDPVAVGGAEQGGSATLVEHIELEPGMGRTIRLRLTRGIGPRSPVGPDASATLGTRASESTAYLASLLPPGPVGDPRRDTDSLLAGLAWASSGAGDTADTATDAVMGAVALAVADPAAAKLRLLARVTNDLTVAGPAVEPPLGAWAALRIHEMGEALTGQRDHAFLEGMFQPLLEDYSRWMDRLDTTGRSILQGGLLGLDGISTSAAGAAWMGCYSVWMLSLAIELARDDATYQDVTETFLDTSLAMVRTLDDLGGSGVGMWDDAAGVLRDVVRGRDGEVGRVPTSSAVGLVPLLGVALIPREALARLPDVSVRLNWSMRHQESLTGSLVRHPRREGWSGDAFVSLVPVERRSRALARLDAGHDEPSPALTCLLLDMIDRVRAFDSHGAPPAVGDALAARLAADPGAPAWATILERAMWRSRLRA